MRKWTSVRIAAVVVLALSIWQGSHIASAANKPYAGTTLNMLVCCPTVAQFVAMQNMTNNTFTPQTGIKVHWDTSTPFGSIEQKLVTTAIAGTGEYDIAAWPDSWGSAIKQYMLPLDSDIKKANINLKDWPKGDIAAAKTLDGKHIVGLPFRGHAQLLFYRKDVFKKLHLTPPSTWQALIKDATTIRSKTKLDPLALYYGGLGEGQNIFIWLNMLWSNNGTLLTKSGQPKFDSPAGIQATQMYMDLLHKYHITNPSALTDDEGTSATIFQKGNAAMWIGWSWYEELFTNPADSAAVVNNNTSFVAAPGMAGKSRAAYAYIWEASVLKSSKHQAAAEAYLNWLTSASVERKILLNKSDPKTDTVVGQHLSNLTNPAVNAANYGVSKEMAAILKHSRNEPLIPQWLKVQSILEIAINKMANGAPVKSTLAQAQKDVAAAVNQS
jgi:multiple sugar transport system substrate-binding protein